MGKILIVDDDSSARNTLSALLTRHETGASEATSGVEALEMLANDSFDVVITDLRMEEMSGLDLLRKIKNGFPEVEVIVLTTYGSIQGAVDAKRAGAFDFITKPFKGDELFLVLERALERRNLVSEVKYLREVVDYRHNFGTVIGESKSIRNVTAQVLDLAPTDLPVLVKGAPGTGKELIAHSLHLNSPRNDRRFFTVSTQMMPEAKLERQLFGYLADDDSVVAGSLQTADGGTLFLDDVAELGTTIQRRLLQLLYDSTITPVGTGESRRVDVRAVVATSRDLSELTENGTLCKDLAAIVTRNVIELPLLRDRGEDILILAEHFLSKYAREFGKRPMTLTPEAARGLLKHSWDGNVRELENAIRRTAAMTNDDIVRKEDLILVASTIEGPHRLQLRASTDANQSLEEKELEYIVSCLTANNWNCTRTAKELGIGRTTLWRKMKKLKAAESTSAGVNP